MSTTPPRLRLLAPAHPTTRGRGECAGHHGELLQGAFWSGGELPTRALVTLPYPVGGAVSHVELDPAGEGVQVTPPDKTKAAEGARLVMAELGLTGGCRLSLAGELPSGWGLGSSTADTMAAVRAVAAAAGATLADAAVAKLVVRAEQASDPVMFHGTGVALFAHREGVVLEQLAPMLPPLLVVGCNAGGELGVSTLDLPPADYTPAQLEEFGFLRAALRRAVRTGDAGSVGRVATRSAILNQAFCALPHFEDLLAVADRTGAVGVQVAHSGTVAGLLYDAADPMSRLDAEAGRSALTRLGLASWQFSPYAARRSGADLAPAVDQ